MNYECTHIEVLNSKGIVARAEVTINGNLVVWGNTIHKKSSGFYSVRAVSKIGLLPLNRAVKQSIQKVVLDKWNQFKGGL